MSAYNPVCEVCHSGPKMDRSVCCEDCYYNGDYAIWTHAKAQGQPPIHTLCGERHWNACPMLWGEVAA